MKKTITTAALIGAGLTLAAAPASAEDDYDASVIGGLELSVGGGVSTFAQSNQRDFTGTAGTWDARVAYGTRLPIAVEAAYIGSAQSIDALGLDGDAMLLSNGLEGAARLNILPGPLSPYLLGGVAWRRYSIINSERNVSDLLDEDDVFEVPLGVGLGFTVGGLVIDGRATYRFAFDDELVQTRGVEGVDDAPEEDLHTLGARVAVGVEF